MYILQAPGDDPLSLDPLIRRVLILTELIRSRVHYSWLLIVTLWTLVILKGLIMSESSNPSLNPVSCVWSKLLLTATSVYGGATLKLNFSHWEKWRCRSLCTLRQVHVFICALHFMTKTIRGHVGLVFVKERLCWVGSERVSLLIRERRIYVWLPRHWEAKDHLSWPIFTWEEGGGIKKTHLSLVRRCQHIFTCTY